MSGASSQIKVSPHTIPGTLHLQNKPALDWGCQGLLAYGCHSCVAVVDPRSVQLLQTLSHHKTNVIKVRWAPSSPHPSLSSPYNLRLASVDYSSICVVWDVTEGSVYTEFSLGSHGLVDLQWLTINDSCRDLLAVLVAPGIMTIWNADTGTRVSRFTFAETLNAFLFNPFKSEEMLLQSTQCLILISDFNPGHNPTGGGKKLYLVGGDSSPLPGRGKAPPYLQHRLVPGEQLRGEETISMGEGVRVLFSSAVRHRLFIMFSREIWIMDTEMAVSVGMVALERSASPFLSLLPASQRDVLYCVHENGCVSVRACQPPPSHDGQFVVNETLEIRYTLHAHSEPLRISKNCQVYAGGLCPTSQTQVAVLTSEGRVLFWECEFEEVGVGSSDPTLLALQRPDHKLCLEEAIAPTWLTPSEGYFFLSLRLTLTHLWAGITCQPSALRMCPPLTTRNWLTYAPLLALGTHSGEVLVFNLAKRSLLKEFSIHSCPVYGIEWTGQDSFVSYGYTSPTSGGLVRNEVALTDTRTGKVTFIRRPDVPSSGVHQTPIDSVKISYQKRYIVIKYLNRPLEFYDAKSHTFLRELVSNPPTFSCIDWTPNHNRSRTPKVDPLTLGMSSAAVDFDLAMGASDGRASQASVRELLSVMDENGSMWQISIDGSKVRVVNSQPTQTWLNNPTCITWKGELMVAGDSNGVLIFLDAKSGQARTIESPRAAVRRLRFAPGKGNAKLIVLYTLRLDIRDASSDVVLSQLKWTGKEAAVEDADWATSDKAVVLKKDGTVRVYDIPLKNCHSPVVTADLAAPLFCPHTLPAQGGLMLKTLLQNQPWKLGHSLDPQQLNSDNAVERGVQEQLAALPEDYIEALTSLGLAGRCLLTARLFGDQRELLFWSLAAHYMRDPQSLESSPSRSNEFKELSGELLGNSLPPLDLRHDLLCDSETFKKNALDRVLMFDSRRVSSEQTRRCADRLMLLGQTDRAVQMLLETDSSSELYYTDALRACLAASIRSSGASQSTIKLVATNLIANSKLFEGVQMLCLIDKSGDSCRYLQTYGEWLQAAWLAKVTLAEKDSHEVLSRWAEHLTTVSHKDMAVLVHLSLRQFSRALEMLHSMRCFEQAALFAEACLERSLLEEGPLIETVFLDYARYLRSLSLLRGFRHYCERSGEGGRQLLEQVNSTRNCV